MRLLPFEYAVRNLGRSPARLVLSIAAAAIVVLMLVAAGGFVRGMSLSLQTSGGHHNVMLMGAGSEESVERSEVDAGVASLVAASIPGIRSSGDVSFVSPEVHVALPVLPGRITQETGAAGDREGRLVMVRGVTPAAMLVHGQAQIIEGRLPAPGMNEVMVGAMAHTRIGASEHDLALGKTLHCAGRAWSIVGRFVAPGTVMEAEVWAPLTDVLEAAKRQTVSTIVLTLDPSRAEFADVAAFTKMRVDLELSATTERDYYARLQSFYAPIRMGAWVTAGLIGLGGLLGGLNALYAAFAPRVREFGTVQAIGFRRGAIFFSLMQESVIASAAGALFACGVGVLALDGLSVRFSMGAFGLVVDAPVIASALGAGLCLGVFGAWPPAWRCLRMPIPVALKAA